MYREILALSLHQHRPDFEVRIAPPETAEEQLRSFRPHVLVRSDTDGLGAEALAEVPFQVEVIYADSMDAKVILDGREEEVKDASTEDLLRVADEARRWLSAEGRIP
jgi:hypothetical protein